MKRLSPMEAYTISLLAQTKEGKDRERVYKKYVNQNIKIFSRNAKQFIKSLGCN
jgi:hypothetical protein